MFYCEKLRNTKHETVVVVFKISFLKNLFIPKLYQSMILFTNRNVKNTYILFLQEYSYRFIVSQLRHVRTTCLLLLAKKRKEYFYNNK